MTILKHIRFWYGEQASLFEEKWGTGKPTPISTTELEQRSHRGLVAVDGGIKYTRSIL